MYIVGKFIANFNAFKVYLDSCDQPVWSISQKVYNFGPQQYTCKFYKITAG